MSTTKAATQIRVDETAYAKTKAISEKELRSLNAQMEYFIIKGIDAYEREHGEIILLSEWQQLSLLYS